MHKTIPVALAAAALALTGCSASAPASAPTVTVTAPQAAPAPANPVEPDTDSAVGDDDLYLMLLRNEDPIFNSIDDRTLINLGNTTCEAFDAGMNLDMYAAVAADSGITRSEAATIAAASIVVYCPWHEGIAG